MSAPQDPNRHDDPRTEQPPALDASDGGDADEAGVRSRARQRERRYFVALTTCVGVGLLLTTGLGVLAGVGGVDGLADLEPVEWVVVVGLPVGVLLLVLLAAGGLMVWRRRRGSALFAPSPLWELPTQAERRDLLRALRRGQPIDPAHHDLAERVVQDMTRRRGLIWLYVVIGALQGVNGVIGDGLTRWIAALSVLLFLGLASQLFWLIRRMNQALRHLDHPDTNPGPEASAGSVASRRNQRGGSEGRDGR